MDDAVKERGYAWGALVVFLRMEGVDISSFSPQEFCKRLVSDMKAAQDDLRPQLVTGQGKSSWAAFISDRSLLQNFWSEKEELLTHSVRRETASALKV